MKLDRESARAKRHKQITNILYIMKTLVCASYDMNEESTEGVSMCVS